MNTVSAVVLFILVWWCTLFCVLPIGMASQYEDHGDNIAPGAPKHVNMKKKLLITTVVSGIIWFGLYLCINYDLINLRDVLDI